MNTWLRYNQKGENHVDTSDGNLEDLVETTSKLKTVIYTKANMLANGRWVEMNGDKEVENSEIVRTLENPNPLMNGNEWLRSLSINYDIYGNSFINCIKPFKAAIPSVYWVLPSKHISVVETGKIWKQVKKNKIIENYKLDDASGRREVFDVSDIIHFKETNSLNPIIGVSKIKSLMLELSNLRGALGFRNRIITNDAALGILSSALSDNGMGMPLDDAEQARLNAGYNQSFGMQEGKSNILMSSVPLKWNSTSYPTKDLLLFEEVDSSFRAIIDAYGLNDNIFSKDQGSTYENLAEGIKLAYQNCIIPFAEDIALGMSLANGLDGKTKRLKLDFSHIEFLKEDMVKASEIDKRNAETYAILSANGREDLAKRIYE